MRRAFAGEHHGFGRLMANQDALNIIWALLKAVSLSEVALSGHVNDSIKSPFSRKSGVLRTAGVERSRFGGSGL